MKENTSSATPHPRTLWGFVLIGLLAVSCASILIRLADAPAVTIAAYRVALASLALGPYYVYKQHRAPSSRSSGVLTFTLLSGFFLAFHFLFWIHSLQKTTVASSVTLVSTTPLFVALFSFLWLGERPGPHLKSGIGCTFIGSAFIAGTDLSFSQEALAGDVLALLGAVMAAGYLLAGRCARRSSDLTAYAFHVYGTAALVLFTCCLMTGSPLAGFSKKTYLIFLLLGLVPQLIGHTVFNWTLRYLSATVVAVLILGEPIGATLLAYFFLGETVSGVKGIGLLILGTGIVLSSLAVPYGKSGE